MVDFPEKIWAIEKGYPSRYRVSCSVLEHGPDEATEYVRADLYAALEAQLAEALKALEMIANNTCCDGCQEAALVARAALKEALTKAEGRA